MSERKLQMIGSAQEVREAVQKQVTHCRGMQRMYYSLKAAMEMYNVKPYVQIGKRAVDFLKEHVQRDVPEVTHMLLDGSTLRIYSSLGTHPVWLRTTGTDRQCIEVEETLIGLRCFERDADRLEALLVDLDQRVVRFNAALRALTDISQEVGQVYPLAGYFGYYLLPTR